MKGLTKALIVLGGLAVAGGAFMAGRGAPTAGHVLPAPQQPFKGTIARTADQSTPDFPQQSTAPQGAPNVVLILTDDVGFSAASTFGGLIPTPNLDRLATAGLRYNRFHTTAMCSPTRASLLTGRNSHAVSTGTVLDMTTGYPGYWSMIPKSAATVAEVLRLSGYNTAFFGKHHNVPSWQKAAGPYDLWPTGLGFEYFYGFLGGDTDQWTPTLYRNTTLVEPPTHLHNGEPDPTYILDRDLADDVIHWIHTQKAAGPKKPFFVYFAPGSAHAPHQAPKEWIAKFRGQFDGGWDKVREDTFARQKAMGIIPADTVLTPRSDAIPAWETLSADQKKVFARMMEVYAAMLAYQDAQIGRVLDEIERIGQRDNTLVIFVEGDNGASPEGGNEGSLNEIGTLAGGVEESIGWKMEMLDELGGPKTHGHFPIGWAWALDTPFQWMKTFASHLGGTRNGMVLSWPARVKDHGGLRTQFHHVIDVMPTILEAVGVPMPDVVNGVQQQRIDGASMVYTFDDADAAERRTTQYFEMLGSLGIYHDGWMASSTPNHFPGKIRAQSNYTYNWELYDLSKDFSQARDLAKAEPAKLKQMEELFWKEAERNHVLPIDDSMNIPRAFAASKAYGAAPASLILWGPNIRIAEESAPAIRNRTFSLTADVIVPEAGAEGVLAANGGRFGGWSFYLKDGKPTVTMAFSQQAQHHYRVAADSKVPPGKATIRYDFAYDGGGAGKGGLMRISINGTEVAQGRIPRTLVTFHDLTETFDTGRDTGTA
jgi:arylsulfatase